MVSGDYASAPARVPGWSALTWMRIIRWITIVGTAIGAVSFLIPWIPGVGHSAWWFVGFVGGFGPTLVVKALALVGVPNEKREVAAGYTTLQRNHPEVEQVDPKTGEVVRLAGQPFLGGPWSAHPFDEVNGVKRPRILSRVARSAVVAMGPFVVAGVLTFVVQPLPGISRSAVAIVVLAVLAVYAIAVGVGALRMRRRLRLLRSAAPNEFAFTFRNSNEAEPTLRLLTPLNGADSTLLSLADGATASHEAITFWEGKPLRAVAVLPWAAVVSVQQDVASIGRYNVPRVIISCHAKDSSRLLALTLPKAEANYLGSPSALEVRWIAAELDDLRTSGTSARVL